MAAHTIFTTTTSTTNSLLFSIAAPNTNPSPSLHSSFHGVSLNLKSKTPQSLTLSAATAPKLLTVFAATKKAVAVLKGNSNVEGVVTLSQDDDGCLLFHPYCCLICGFWPKDINFSVYFSSLYALICFSVVTFVDCDLKMGTLLRMFHTLSSESLSVHFSTLYALFALLLAHFWNMT